MGTTFFTLAPPSLDSPALQATPATSAAWETLKLARKHLWQEGNPQAAIALLASLEGSFEHLWQWRLWQDSLCNAYVLMSDWQRLEGVAQRLQHPYFWGKALLRQGRLPQAFGVWQACRSSEAHPKHLCWEGLLEAICADTLLEWPAFLQLRNRSEESIGDLYLGQHWDGLNAFLSYVESLSQVNPELFKLVGRALLFAGESDTAYALLQRALAVNPMDAEVYYHLGQWYALQGRVAEGIAVLKQNQWIAPNYVPAADLLAELAPPSPQKEEASR